MTELRQAQLPKNWKCKKLGDIASVEYGFTDKAAPEGSYRYVRITDIDKNGELVKTAKMYINSSDDANKFILSDNELLMARTGATFAKVLLYRDNEPSVFASYLIKIKFSENIVNKLYWYFSKSKNYWEQANELSSGAAQPHFNGKALKQVVFSYPTSVDEQKQIVAVLDKAFAAIDLAKANIEKNLQNAKELFQSKLNEIFTQKGEGWEEKKLGDSSLLSMIDGDRGKNYPKKSDFFQEGHCVFMNTGNVRPNGFDFSTVMFVSEERDKLLRKGKLQRNDVVMTTRGTIGNLGWFNDDVKYENIRINSGMLIFRVNQQKVLPEYLFTVLRSPVVTKQIEEMTSGAAQPQLPIKTLIHFDIPFHPDLVKQRNMIGKIQELESMTDNLVQIGAKKLRNLDELKKSILQKAFAGELI